MDTTSPYEYPPLKEYKAIRTIELLDTPDSSLECILNCGRLDKLQYKCVSYVRGKPEKAYRIIVRDRVSKEVLGHVPLTKNLHNALKDLRDTAEVDDKVFWADQICIHQEDDDKKGRQVELMGEIYTNASTVVMYIGRAAAHDTEALYPADTCYELALRISSKQAIASGAPTRFCYSGSSGLARASGHIAFGVWTERSWIVQENVVNENTSVLRGQKKLDWSSVATMSILFGVRFLPLELLRELRESGKKKASLDCYIDAVCRSLEIKSRKSRPAVSTAFGSLLSLCENLEWYDALQCADPRDHIYSIMALSTDTKRLGIVPNYDHSVQTVYIDATVRMLTTDKMINHLNYVSLLDNLSDPSYPS
ncbi:MAG: hypothetical protein Q9165_007134 [Trypethelium subeluteriae]